MGTDGAGCHILNGVRSYSWPPKTLAAEGQRPMKPRMAGDVRDVPTAEHWSEQEVEQQQSLQAVRGGSMSVFSLLDHLLHLPCGSSSDTGGGKNGFLNGVFFRQSELA